MVSLIVYEFSYGGLVSNIKTALRGERTSLVAGWKACLYNFPMFIQADVLLLVLYILFSLVLVPIKGLAAILVALPVMALILVEFQWVCLSIVVDEATLKSAIKRIWSLTRSNPLEVLGVSSLYLVVQFVVGFGGAFLSQAIAPLNPLLRFALELARVILVVVFQLWSTVILTEIYLNLTNASAVV